MYRVLKKADFFFFHSLLQAVKNSMKLASIRIIRVFIDCLHNHHPPFMCQPVPLQYWAIILENHSLRHATPRYTSWWYDCGWLGRTPHFFLFNHFTISADMKKDILYNRTVVYPVHNSQPTYRKQRVVPLGLCNWCLGRHIWLIVWVNEFSLLTANKTTFNHKWLIQLIFFQAHLLYWSFKSSTTSLSPLSSKETLLMIQAERWE